MAYGSPDKLPNEMRKTLFLLATALPLAAQNIDWTKVNDEAMRNFQSLVQIESTMGHETRVAEFVKKIFDAEGIPSTIVSRDPARANLIARIKGNGTKKPLLIMGH